MKDVYTNTVSYSNPLKRSIAEEKAKIKNHAFTLRTCMAVIISITSLFNPLYSNAQNCPTTGTTTLSALPNSYYPGNASVAAGSTSITLGAMTTGSDFGATPATIAIGDIVLIIQMQGALIKVPGSVSSGLYGGNFSGAGSGFLSNSLSAGKMEFVVATNAVAAGGGALTISSGLVNGYDNIAFGTNGQSTFQAIRVPQYYNIILGATLTAPKWNGRTGGVIVISAVNQLNFNGKTVDATGAGFRGGGTTAYNGNAGLLITDMYTTTAKTANGGKGEGIAGTPRYVFFNGALVDNTLEGYPSGSRAQGAPGNAGGGATDSNPTSNDQNAGGGGGGNGGSGGLGGNGWYSYGFSGGRGGSSFSTTSPSFGVYYAPNRLIMGGGGGGGSSNNATGTPGSGAASSGAPGGGIVIINSNTIIGTGNITSNGGAANNTVTIDGSGGGGAGGSILIYAVSGHAGLTAIANGSDGASNDPNSVGGATQHGPGGGGGGGVIYSNGTLNAASKVNPGNHGISVGPAVTDSFFAQPGFVGVLTQTFPFTQLPPKMQICQTIVLPVTMMSFNASYVAANNVKVTWTTSDEINADYFEVERSTDGAAFAPVGMVQASETSEQIHAYTFNDQLVGVNSSVVYYRLRIVDKDGKFVYSKTVAVKLGDPENSISIYPNPVDNHATLNLFTDKAGTGVMRLFDNAGKQIFIRSFTAGNGNNSIPIDNLGNLSKGIYIVQVMYNNNLYNQKIIKK